jgi:hypothetical protein
VQTSGRSVSATGAVNPGASASILFGSPQNAIGLPNDAATQSPISRPWGIAAGTKGSTVVEQAEAAAGPSARALRVLRGSPSGHAPIGR